jgi:phage-related protein
MPMRKPIVFLADSLKRLRQFPEGARQDAGRELARVQEGREPIDWKPMPSVGKGAREIRVSKQLRGTSTLPQQGIGRFEGGYS